MSDNQSESFGLQFHPYADLFPLMDGPEFDDLVNDIEQNGLQHPIVTLKGMILDGRNRYRACLDAMLPISTVEYTGKETPLDYVITANLRRRHLNESQRGMILARVAQLPRGRPPNVQTTEKPAISQKAAARLLNVSPDTGQEAKRVLTGGVPELVSRVDKGEVSVSIAAKVARMPKKEQSELAKMAPAQLRGEVKKARRAEREKALAEATRKASESLGKQLYSVILADPPWRFEPYSRDTGMDRAADNHYPTMTTEEIAALKVPAAKGAVLFLWATPPMLEAALSVMKAWGFVYKSHCVWYKDRLGTGYWFRNKHELLLVGTRGDVPAPAPGEQSESVLNADVGKHSKKPVMFAEMIEKMFPNSSRLEMFARNKRDGWDAWGNEA